MLAYIECPSFKLLDIDSPKGQAMQAWAKNRYRIPFVTGGNVPISGLYSLREGIKNPKRTASVFLDFCILL